jgi:lipopolysaccharide export system protein LptA
MKHWSISLLLLLPLPLAAAEQLSPGTTARTAAVTIEADRMELDQKHGTSHYKGNVILHQGALQIKADSITLYSVKKKLQRAVASGNPATLLQQGDNEASAIRAMATQMDYLPQSQVVILKGKAQLWRNGNEFSGDQISYDLKQQLVKASGDNGGGRVRVLLQPEGDNPEAGDRP